MWEPRPLTILWTFTACYLDSFTFLPLQLRLLDLLSLLFRRYRGPERETDSSPPSSVEDKNQSSLPIYLHGVVLN
jgi:hypothetical protein